MENVKDAGVIFLGLAERAAYVREGNTNLFKWNVLGLKHIILSHIYPCSLAGWFFGVAFPASEFGREVKFSVTDEVGNDVGFVSVSGQIASGNEPEAVLRSKGPLVVVPDQGWVTAFIPLGDEAFGILTPGVYHVRDVTEGRNETIGVLRFLVLDSGPLTGERIAAIRSDPTAMKAVRVELGCKSCDSKCRAYAALEVSEKLQEEGWLWYRDLPDVFTCGCGKTRVSLELIRRNLHGLLGARGGRGSSDVSFVPLYEEGSLVSLRSTFAHLLELKPKEEVLQRFLEENPILFHQFASLRLFKKPAILTSYVADFALLTPNKELLLIEIEKTTTKLMRKGGDAAAELNHAFDQVRNWLHVVDEHRLEVLDSWKINKEDVSAVRGIVIGGRDVGYDARDLRRLKGQDRGRFSFLTYDDLLFALDALIKRMNEL